MDCLYLLERLEEVVLDGPRLPLTGRRLVDREECLAILEQVRLSLPSELVDRDSPAEGVEAHPLVRAARMRAEALRVGARRDAERECRDVDAYAGKQLARLSRSVARVRVAVERGMAALRTEEDAHRDPP